MAAIRAAIDNQAQIRERMGQNIQYEDMIDETHAASCYYFCVSWIIDVVLLVIVILILEYYKKSGNKCGIPLYLWIEIWFVIFFTQSTIRLNVLWIQRCRPNAVLPFIIIVFVIWLFFYAIWSVYGFYIYSSDDNDC